MSPKFSFQFLKLGPREKSWAVLWLMVVLVITILRMGIQPKRERISEAMERIESLEREKIRFQARYPEVERRKNEIEGIKQEIAARYEELSAAEQDLLDTQDVDELLESLVKDRGRFEMRLNSIRPVQEKTASAVEPTQPGVGRSQGDPYRKLKVQVDLFSTFQGLVDYIHFLERMRSYQMVESIQVKVEGKEVSRPHAVLMVSSLMGGTPQEKETQRKEIFALLEDVAQREKKDPFLTAERPKEIVQATGLQLTGIFSEGSQPVAAMINNEIYRVGDVIQGKRIVAIEAARVLLEQGNRRFVLVATQQGGSNQ